MKRLQTIFTITLTLILLSACNSEDDIEEIFVGRTWYMNGIVINGTTSSEETKHFYNDTDNNCYYIKFSSGTFQGKLSSGVAFSGTWQADGKHQTITLRLKDRPNADLPFDRQILNILSSVTSYKSGANFMHLNDNNQNTIRFGNIR